jgi:mannan endo-1,4-beta-mannosidase
VTLLLLLSLLQGAPLRVEAETGSMIGKAVVQNTDAGFSGTGYVGGFQAAGDRVTVSVTVPTTGVYQIRVGYRTPNGQKGIDVFLDGTKVGSITAAANTTWTSAVFAETKLTAGAHTISVGDGWGWFQIDWIEIESSTPAPPVRPSAPLVDPKADTAARRLHGWMLDQYGKKVITGQTDSAEAKWLFQQTGKLPAIIAFDMMDHTPSRHALGGTGPTESVEMARRWGRNGGIVAYQWHWVPPSGVSTGTDANGNPAWWGGFYTANGTFDIAKALADTNGSDYRGLMRDVDSISALLAKLRDAGIPVLWRPLHEASGGWFWWGAKGSAPAKKLWNILYDRMTRRNGLHNLIWVWTSATDAGAADWYPGDSVVDIVGLDVYSDSSNALSTDWKALVNLVGAKKLVAVSECGHGDGSAPGVLPTPENVALFQTWWSYAVTWSGSHVHRWPTARLSSIYSSPTMITYDELPKWNTLPVGVADRSRRIPSSAVRALRSLDGRIVPTSATLRPGIYLETTPEGIAKRVIGAN